MTDDQDLANRRMLDKSWELGPLPDDPDKLATLVGYLPEKFRSTWSYPLTDYWKKTHDGRLVNLRLEDERSRASKRSSNARDAGKKSGIKRRDISKKKKQQFNKCRTNVQQAFDADLKNLIPKEIEMVRGNVRLVENKKTGEKKLEASEKFKSEFFSLWRRYLSHAEIMEQIEEATRNLIGSQKHGGDNLDEYLHAWVNGYFRRKNTLGVP